MPPVALRVVSARKLLHHLGVTERHLYRRLDVFRADLPVNGHFLHLGLEAQVLERVAFLTQLASGCFV